MKILFAADGSKYTKKALAYLVTHAHLAGPEHQIVVLNVQGPIPPEVKRMVGAGAVKKYHDDEADKVLKPIGRFLERHTNQFRMKSVVGNPSQEIVKASKTEKANLIIMGTRGHGVVGRALLGSVAQRVLTECDMPVLLVK